jgi:hypothetical protein
MNMSKEKISKKQAILIAEEQIEAILQNLEHQYSIRAFRIVVLSELGESPEIGLIVDERGIK